MYSTDIKIMANSSGTGMEGNINPHALLQSFKFIIVILNLKKYRNGFTIYISRACWQWK
jgi:hypothetical protein